MIHETNGEIEDTGTELKEELSKLNKGSNLLDFPL